MRPADHVVNFNRRSEKHAGRRHGVQFRLSSVTEMQDVISLTATADCRHVNLHSRNVGCLSLCVDKNSGPATGKADPWMECMPGVNTQDSVQLSFTMYQMISNLKPWRISTYIARL